MLVMQATVTTAYVSCSQLYMCIERKLKIRFVNKMSKTQQKTNVLY